MAKSNYNLNSGLRFINPYQFVPISGRKTLRTEADEKRSGVLHCRLLVKTPIIIPDASDKSGKSVKKEGKEVQHDMYPFMKIGGKIIIPAGSLRGPIRNVYETASNSCYATMRPDQVITTRAQAEGSSTMKPGILFRADGKWVLYSAKAYRVSKDVLGGRKYGDLVRFEGKQVNGTNRQGKPYTSYEVMNECEGGSKWGFVYIGECFPRKKYERIFSPSGIEESVKDEEIQAAVLQLKRLLQEYRDILADERKRAKLPTGHHAYKHIPLEMFDQENVYIPIWYRSNGTEFYLSPACIGRYAYQNTLNDVLGTYDVCTDRAQACPACTLFGMVGSKDGGRAGRVRFTDAVLMNAESQPHMVNLKELGEPHITYLPFYTKDGKEYDASDIRIAGRKYYWHHEPDAALYEAKEDELSNINASMEVLDDGEFQFDVYYDRVTTQQLQELTWALCLGDNEENGSMCHKIGHAKSFGFGSVKILVDEFEERTFDENGYVVHKGPAEELKYDQAFEKERETASFKALVQILNFSALSEAQKKYPVRYPYIDPNGFTKQYVEVLDKKGEKKIGKNGKPIKDYRYVNAAGVQKEVNVFASHQWYGAFRSAYNKKYQTVSSLPLDGAGIIGEKDVQRLSFPIAVYDPDSDDRGGSGNRGSHRNGQMSANGSGPNRSGSSYVGGAGSGKPTKSLMIKLTEEEKAAGYMAGTIVDKGKNGRTGHVRPYGTNEKVFLLEQYCITPVSQLRVGDHVIFKKEKNRGGKDPFRAVEVHTRQ